LSPTSFVLDDDSQPTNSNTRTFTNLHARNGYSVSDSAPPSGWGLASATCSDGSPVSNIDVGPNETVTCTFTNEKHGSLTIAKDAGNKHAHALRFALGPRVRP